MVVGSESESYRTLRYLVERLPAMIASARLSIKTQPIGTDDELSCLSQAPDVEASASRELKIAGPDVLATARGTSAVGSGSAVTAAAPPFRTEGGWSPVMGTRTNDARHTLKQSAEASRWQHLEADREQTLDKRPCELSTVSGQ